MSGETKRTRIRRLRPEAAHIFDTNFLVEPASTLPVLKNVPGGSRWVTETTHQEVIEQLGTQNGMRALDQYQTLRFDDLYRTDPGVCPVFYWYVAAMYNPANVGGREFFDEAYNSLVIKKMATESEQREYERIQHKIHRVDKDREAVEWLKLLGTISADQEQALRKMTKESLRFLGPMMARTRKKARKSMADGHPAYLRDIKSLALALYYSLSSRQNVVYYTCDGDPISLFLKWLDSMTMWMTLWAKVLPRLGELGQRHVLDGGTSDLVLDAADFIIAQTKLHLGMVRDQGKTKGVRFTIKHWDFQQQKFHEDIYAWFEEITADALANMHANFWCWHTKNCHFGNWTRLSYHWPPEPGDEGKLRVNVTRKPLLNYESSPVSPDEHNNRCKYRQDDFAGKLAAWSQFTKFSFS